MMHISYLVQLTDYYCKSYTNMTFWHVGVKTSSACRLLSHSKQAGINQCTCSVNIYAGWTKTVWLYLLCQEVQQLVVMVVVSNRRRCTGIGPWPRFHFHPNPIGNSLLVNLTPWWTKIWQTYSIFLCNDLKTFYTSWPMKAMLCLLSCVFSKKDDRYQI